MWSFVWRLLAACVGRVVRAKRVVRVGCIVRARGESDALPLRTEGVQSLEPYAFIKARVGGRGGGQGAHNGGERWVGGEQDGEGAFAVDEDAGDAALRDEGGDVRHGVVADARVLRALDVALRHHVPKGDAVGGKEGLLVFDCDGDGRGKVFR